MWTKNILRSCIFSICMIAILMIFYSCSDKKDDEVILVEENNLEILYPNEGALISAETEVRWTDYNDNSNYSLVLTPQVGASEMELMNAIRDNSVFRVDNLAEARFLGLQNIEPNQIYSIYVYRYDAGRNQSEFLNQIPEEEFGNYNFMGIFSSGTELPIGSGCGGCCATSSTVYCSNGSDVKCKCIFFTCYDKPCPRKKEYIGHVTL